MKKKAIIVTSLLVCVTVGVAAVTIRMKQNSDGGNTTSMEAGQSEASSLSAARAEWISSISENWDAIMSAKHDAEKVDVPADDWWAFEAMVALVKSDRDIIMRSRFSALFIGRGTDGKAFLSLSDRYPLTDEQYRALEAVTAFFRNEDNRHLELVRVEEEQITFDTTMGYAVIYMDKDQKPTHLSKIYDKPGYSLSVEKIRPHWYHVFVEQ